MEYRTMRLAEKENMTITSFVVSVFARTILGAGLVISVLAVSPMRSFAQTGGACGDSTSSSAILYRDYYRIAVSSTESHMVAFRAQTGLPNLSQTQVRFVGDTTVCRTASIAVDAHRWDKFPQTSVLVLELGTTRLVVKDVNLPAGMLNYLFNQTFSTLLMKMVF
jgi:hypothetical protein